MDKLLSRANKSLTVGKAAWLLSGSFALSAVLGLLRERLLLANFGVGETLDAYIIAFSIPDFMFYLLVSGALSVTFIPVLTQRMKTSKLAAWELSSSLVNFMAQLTLAASVLIFIFADPLVGVVARGASPYVKDTAADLMRIIAVNPFLFSISSVLASMQQAAGRFFFNSLAPVIYNIGIIIGIVFFAPAIGTPEEPAILGVALGVGLGAIMQLLVQLLGMWGMGFEYRTGVNWQDMSFKKVLSLLPARSLDQGIDYFNAIIERFIASFLFAGAITAYQAAFVLQNVPITLIGVAISTAAFPRISQKADARKDVFRREIESVLKVILWLAIPAAIIAFIMRGYLVRLLIGSGNAVIASILGWFVFSIVFRALFHTVTRAFYAQQDTKTPLVVSIAAVLLNIVLGFTFVEYFGIAGLAMAQSAVAIFEVVVLMVILQGRVGKIITLKMLSYVWSFLLAGLAAAIVNYILVAQVFTLGVGDSGFFTLMPKFVIIVLTTLATYLVASFILKIEYAKPVVKALVNLVYRPIKIQN